MSPAIRQLRQEVMGGPLCTACGACAGLCPYVVVAGDRVACVEECRKDDGRCYRYCPRSGASRVTVTRRDPSAAGGSSLGALRSVRLARAARAGADAGEGRDAPPRQHGGVTSALVAWALRSHLIDGAVLSAGEGGVARPVLVTDAEDAAACAGSKFGLGPTVAEVNRALQREVGRLGVVALPCQATALRRMREDPVAVGVPPAESIGLVIGLFCTWALGQDAWRNLRDEWVGGSRVARIDIPPPPADVLVVETETGAVVEIPLARVRPAVRPACRVCLDMTAEDADIAVGMAEGDWGWNTVIVRTEAGERAFEGALAAGRLEACEPRVERIAHLEEASAGKKRRATAEAAEWEGEAPYLVDVRGAGGRVEP